MDTKEIIRYWGFPRATIINRNLPKTQIYPHIKLAKDKKFLQDTIQSIYMLASFKTENTNIPKFETDTELYQEIQFLYVSTKIQGEAKKIYKLLASLIPYPLIILVDEPENFVLYAGKFEKLSTGYLKLLNCYPSPVYLDLNMEEVLPQFTIDKFPRQNLKELYAAIRDSFSTELAKVEYGEELDHVSSEKKDQLDELKTKLEQLKAKIRKENQLNRKIEMQMELRNLKLELQKLIAE